MTGTLTYAAAVEHQSELRAAATNGSCRKRRPRFERRMPALPGSRRPRRAFA